MKEKFWNNVGASKDPHNPFLFPLFAASFFDLKTGVVALEKID